MILLVAIVMGLLAGLARARYHRRPFVLPELRLTWLASVAFLPQWLAFFFAPTRRLFSDQTAATALVASQILLSGFALLNRHHPAMKLLTVGLWLNLTVIVANGGLMPISPETLKRLVPKLPDEEWIAGKRFGNTKDRILPASETTFAWLSDRFIFSTGSAYRVAYSIGDLFIAIGAFGFLWSAGGVHTIAVEPHESVN